MTKPTSDGSTLTDATPAPLADLMKACTEHGILQVDVGGQMRGAQEAVEIAQERRDALCEQIAKAESELTIAEAQRAKANASLTPTWQKVLEARDTIVACRPPAKRSGARAELDREIEAMLLFARKSEEARRSVAQPRLVETPRPKTRSELIVEERIARDGPPL